MGRNSTSETAKTIPGSRTQKQTLQIQGPGRFGKLPIFGDQPHTMLRGQSEVHSIQRSQGDGQVFDPFCGSPECRSLHGEALLLELVEMGPEGMAHSPRIVGPQFSEASFSGDG